MEIDMEKQESFVQRMCEEQTALQEKLVKLNGYLCGEQFQKLDDYNKSLLIRQREAMAVYFEVLTARIALIAKH